MRERAAATIFMWIAVATSIGLILGSLKYTEFVASPINTSEMVAQTMLVPEAWQLGAAVLIFMLITGATAGTVAIWNAATRKDERRAQQAEKAKREDRDARIKRLLATMDDDDLDALEHERLLDDGERLSLESLLRKRG